MKPKLFLIILALLSPFFLHAQIIFQKAYGGGFGDWGNSIQQTTDGEYIITGGTNSFTLSWYHDLYLIKTDSNGDLMWSKSYGGDEGNETGLSVLQTNEGGFIIVGVTFSFGQGGSDLYLIRTNSTGDTLWTKTFGGDHNDGGKSIQQTSDGGFILTGYTGGGVAGTDYDIYLIKLDSEGSILWTKTYGGTGDDYGESVQQTIDGGFIIAGYGTSFGAGTWDFYLIKTDDIGNISWSKTYGGPNADYGHEVQQTSDGGYIITGTTGGFSTNNWDVYLIKTDSVGDVSWSKTYGGTQPDYGNSVQQTLDDGFVIVGETLENVLIIRTTSTGDTLWTKTFGGTGNDLGSSIILTNDGGLAITGDIQSPPINFYGNVYLIKTDANGNSGCYENYHNSVVSEVNPIVTSPTLQISSGGTSGNPATNIVDGGTETVLCTSVGIKNIQYSGIELKVCPNPFTSFTTLQTDRILKNATLIIYNSFGQRIREIEQITGKTFSIQRQDLLSGIYYLQIVEDEISLPLKKLIITDF